MAAMVHNSQKVEIQVVVEAGGAHQPLVQMVWGLWEAMAVLAPCFPSQAPPPHMLGEAGVQGLPPRALAVQGAEGPAAPCFFQTLPLVYPTLVVVAGEIMPLVHQVAQAS
jgi:hypothetical protein